MKHIESIQPEYAASEIDRMLVGDDDATATAALTALLHSVTGCDIPQTSDLPESEVEELVPLCVSILRRHWQTPLTCLGDGTTPMSLSDLMRQAIGDRVQGNEALGIPPANANIPTALAALRDRKIGGIPQAPDGISLVHLLTSTEASDSVTELQDSNIGWVMDKANALSNIASHFTNIADVTLGCAEVTSNILYGNNSSIKRIIFPHLISTTAALIRMYGNGEQRLYVEEMIFPQLQRMGCLMEYSGNGWWTSQLPDLHNVSFPKLKKITQQGGGRGALFEIPCPSLEVLEFPELESMGRPLYGGSCLSNLRELRMPNLKSMVALSATYLATTDSLPNLILLEVGEMQSSMDIRYWQPSADILSNPEFLSNFQTYIADRVADRTGETALTLTLSAAVYEALQAQEGQTILATLTNKNWTVAQA